MPHGDTDDSKLKIALQVEVHDLSMSTHPGAAFRWFAFCQTVAFDTEETFTRDQVDRYLLPWLWEVEKLDAEIVPGDGSKSTTLKGVTLEPRPTPSQHPLLSGMNSVKDRIWDQGGQANFKTGKEQVIRIDSHPWAGVLRSAADYPDELPQVLGVTRYFKIQNDKLGAAAAKLYAAPHIGAFMPEKLANGMWLYQGPAEAPQMFAHVEPAALSTKIDGWITPDADTGTSWLQHLPEAFANALQPARVVLGLLREKAYSKDVPHSFITDEANRLFRDAQLTGFVGGVIAHAGLENPSQAKTAIEEEVKKWGTVLEDLKDAAGVKDPVGRVGDWLGVFDLPDAKLADIVIWPVWQRGLLQQTEEVRDAVKKSLGNTPGVGQMLRLAATAEEWKKLTKVELSGRAALESHVLARLEPCVPPATKEVLVKEKLWPEKAKEVIGSVLERAFQQERPNAFQGIRVRYAEPTADGDAQKTLWDQSHHVLPLMRLKKGIDDGWTVPSSATVDGLNRTAAVPMQLVAVNGMLQAMEEYRNQPWAAPSPLSEMATQRSIKPTSKKVVNVDSLLPYKKLPSKSLARLVEERDYYFAVARVGIAGNLPWEIAESGKPWLLASNIRGDLPDQKEVTYKRTYPVGQVRVSPISVGQGSQAITQKMALLSAQRKYKPDEERPIANLLFASGTFFTQETSSYEFQVRPPTVPIEVWEAAQPSLAKGTPAREALVGIRVKHALNGDKTDDDAATDRGTMLEKLNKRPNGWLPSDQLDVTLDDPAVIGYYIEKGIEQGEQRFTAEAQRSPMKFTITLGSNDKVDVSQANAVTITVDQALSLSELRIGALTSTKRGPASLITVEAAQPFPKVLSKELHACLEAGSRTAASFAEIPLKINWESTPNIKTVANFIERVELQAQKYIWDGRPLEYPVYDDKENKLKDWVSGFRFPASGEKPDAYETCLANLDGMYFGGRDSDDRRDEPWELTEFLEATHAQLRPWPLGAGVGAEYYRFAVRVINRYAPVLKPEFAVIDSQKDLSPGEPERWKRAVVPCRLTGKRNPPAVKLILPLTSAAPGCKAPDLLVVLEENALDHPGLAAGMQVRVAQVEIPGLPADTPDSIYELGPDPMQELPEKPEPYKAVNPAALSLRGPVGYTFDTGATNPRFVRTSYTVPVEDVLKQAGVKTDSEGFDPTWWFLKISVRHTVHPRGVIKPVAGTETELDSDWTTPVWTQVLPAGNRWLLFADGNTGRMYDAGDLRIRANFQLVQIGHDKPLNGDRKTLHNGLLFQTWALIMEPISDLLGRPGQERFWRLVPLSKLGVEQLPATSTIRLVGVQFREDAPETFSALTKCLFPDGSHASARIVQISPPIERN
jgi:hypothetical protein